VPVFLVLMAHPIFYGHEDVLNDCDIPIIRPILLTTHKYRHEKNGLLPPFRSKVRAAYPGVDSRDPIEGDRINFAYDKYKFLGAQTEAAIIK